LPNIEIHGVATDKVPELRRQIFQLFQGKSYINEIVVTTCFDVVENKDGKHQPFIRVLNDCQTHTEEILELLRPLGLDIEHLPLKSFIEKNK
jgi:hypothetical protein